MKTREDLQEATAGFSTAVFHGHTVIDLAEAEGQSLETFYARFGKPAFDRFAAFVLAVVASPLMLTVALVVLASLGRPILIRQQRVGLDGRRFDMLKFRTMEPDRRSAQRPFHGGDRRSTHKTVHDPRHTRAGRVLRRLSLDELPQLWNVLTGDMSLVGPRPEMALIVEGYEPWKHQRHLVRPGLTGLWQTTQRESGVLGEFIHLDLVYIRQMSLRNDLVLLLRTVPALLRPKGF